jgi:hypothetical protein
MSIGDIIGSATKKLRPRRKDKTRTVVLASAGIASALWAAMKLKKELYGPGGTRLSRYDRSVDKRRKKED